MVGVRIANLTHEFDGREVFTSLDFAYDGPCLAVMGPNGSGKSTLLRILSGLLTPSSGEAVFVADGEQIARDSVRNMIGMVAPDIRLYAELSAKENLRFLLRARGVSSIETNSAAAIERVGLGERADDPVGELSSGLRQRAALAAAIAHEPNVLLLDEPSSNLDEAGVSMLRNLIEEWREKGLVVIATNDPHEAALGSERLDLRIAG